jgi:CRISPR system Cascade subunit CasE
MHHRVFAGRNASWSDNYWIHTKVMQLFGDLGHDDQVRLRAGILFRLEPELGTGRVLVQSTDPTIDEALRRVDLGGVLSQLRTGQRVGLRLKVNAAKTANRTAGGQVHQTRVVLEPGEIAGWVENKLQAAFSAVTIAEITTGLERQRKTPLAVATIDALATVGDPEVLAQLVGTGIGKAKAFGCGLLTLRSGPAS